MWMYCQHQSICLHYIVWLRYRSTALSPICCSPSSGSPSRGPSQSSAKGPWLVSLWYLRRGREWERRAGGERGGRWGGRVRGGRPPRSRCRWMRRRRRSWWSRRGRWSRPHRSPRGTKQKTFLIQLKNDLVVWDLLWLRAGDGPSFPNFYCTVHNLVFYHCTCWVPTFSSFLTGKIWRLKVVYFSFVLTLRGKFSLQFQDTCRPFPNMASLGYSLTWPALAIP